MWINNQDRNYGINVNDTTSIRITHYYSDDIVARLHQLATFPAHPMLCGIGKEAREGCSKRIKEYIKEKMENQLERTILQTTEQMYYKIVIDDITFAMYIDKEKAYSVYANMFLAIGMSEEAFEMPKDIEGENKI